MIYGYCRVSTDRQTLENQRYEIGQFARRSGVRVDRWVSETVSSRIGLGKRALAGLLRRMRAGDTVVATEISRIGRDTLEVMSILQRCLDKKCQVWTIKENYRLGADIQSEILAFCFGLAAKIERQLISSRVREALARRKAEGKQLGRPVGSKGKECKLSGKEKRVKNLLGRGMPKTRMARMLGVNPSTLYRFIAEMG
jgi:DNA invertase Pin-like site-specific DNA recombinase